MEEGSRGGASIPISAVKNYFGATDFMDNFDEEKSTKKQLFDLFILNELIDQKDVVGVCISFQCQTPSNKEFAERFYKEIRKSEGLPGQYRDFFIFSTNRTSILNSIKSGEIIPAFIVRSPEITPPCLGYYIISDNTSNVDDVGDVYYVKTSDVKL